VNTLDLNKRGCAGRGIGCRTRRMKTCQASFRNDYWNHQHPISPRWRGSVCVLLSRSIGC